LISEGGYAFVFRVRDSATENLYALKRIKGNVKMGEKEVEIWREIGKHPNIVSFIQAEIKPGPQPEVVIVNELCTGGTLYQFIASQKTPLNENQVLKVFKDIVLGVKHLH